MEAVIEPVHLDESALGAYFLRPRMKKSTRFELAKRMSIFTLLLMVQAMFGSCSPLCWEHVYG